MSGACARHGEGWPTSFCPYCALEKAANAQAPLNARIAALEPEVGEWKGNFERQKQAYALMAQMYADAVSEVEALGKRDEVWQIRWMRACVDAPGLRQLERAHPLPKAALARPRRGAP